MTSSDSAIWQTDGKTNFAIRLPMARTQRTYERTYERYGKPQKSSLVLDSSKPVDNPNLVASSIQAHELVAVDAAGSLCACGVKGDRLEHLADVALFLMGTTKPLVLEKVNPEFCAVDDCNQDWYCRGFCRRHYKQDLKARKSMDAPTELWSEDQQRRHNLASFSRVVPVRVRRPSRDLFTLEQLIIAERVAREKAA